MHWSFLFCLWMQYKLKLFWCECRWGLKILVYFDVIKVEDFKVDWDQVLFDRFSSLVVSGAFVFLLDPCECYRLSGVFIWFSCWMLLLSMPFQKKKRMQHAVKVLPSRFKLQISSRMDIIQTTMKINELICHVYIRTRDDLRWVSLPPSLFY